MLFIQIALFRLFGENQFLLLEEWPIEFNDSNIAKKFKGHTGELILFNNDLLVNVKEYSNTEHRYNSNYYYVDENTIGDQFIIESGYEIRNIQRDEDKYYAILWSKNDSYLAVNSIDHNLSWERIYTFSNDTSKEYTLYIQSKKLCIISNEKIYLNIDGKTIKAFDLPEYNGSDTISHPSIAITHNNIIYLGNDFGEWGGNLYRVEYNQSDENLEYEKLISDNVHKVVNTENNEIYAIVSYGHLGLSRTGLFQINDDEVSTIYYKVFSSYKKTKLNDSRYEGHDLYGWESQIGNNKIKDIINYQDQIIQLFSEIGIFSMSKDEMLAKITELPISEKIYRVDDGAPYQIRNTVERIYFINNSLYVSYVLPVFFSNEIFQVGD